VPKRWISTPNAANRGSGDRFDAFDREDPLLRVALTLGGTFDTSVLVGDHRLVVDHESSADRETHTLQTDDRQLDAPSRLPRSEAGAVAPDDDLVAAPYLAAWTPAMIAGRTVCRSPMTA
jgi:hypothetical protein